MREDEELTDHSDDSDAEQPGEDSSGLDREEEAFDDVPTRVHSSMFGRGHIRRYVGEDEIEDENEDESGDSGSGQGHGPTAQRYDQILPDTEDESSAHSDDEKKPRENRSMQRMRRQRASLRIFAPTGRLFRIVVPMQIELSSSPPVFHPVHPLVVWPLSAEKVLFVDYQENTYRICPLAATLPDSEWHVYFKRPSRN